MTKFNHYAKKVDEIAREAFEGLIIAEAAYRDAEKKHTEYKAPTYGRMNFELAAKSARSEANLIEAKEALKRAKESMYKYPKSRIIHTQNNYVRFIPSLVR